MRVLPHQSFQGSGGQLEFISAGAIFGAHANATNSFKAAIYLTEIRIGPSDIVARQQPA